MGCLQPGGEVLILFATDDKRRRRVRVPALPFVRGAAEADEYVLGMARQRGIAQ